MYRRNDCYLVPPVDFPKEVINTESANTTTPTTTIEGPVDNALHGIKDNALPGD